MDKNTFDVIIIGGGPAGMSAALVLGRSRINTLILNTEKPRNAITSHSHGFLTQDGKHPLEILEIAKQEQKKYAAVTYKIEEAIHLSHQNSMFLVRTDVSEYCAKRVILASGYTDHIKGVNIPGLTKVYGKSVFPCPFCDGFEVADKKLAVFSNPEMVSFISKLVSNWSKDIITFTNGEMIENRALVNELEEKNIRVVEQKIKQLHSNAGQLFAIELENGEVINRDAGFIRNTKASESTKFAHRLKLSAESGHFGVHIYTVDDNKETKIKGLYIIGDAQSSWSGVASAVASGSDVAQAITIQLTEENLTKTTK